MIYKAPTLWIDEVMSC